MAVIGSIRKHSWVAVLVVGIAIAAFVISDFFKRDGSRVHTNVGSVGGDDVSYNEFQYKVDEIETRYKTQQGKDQISTDEHFSIQENAWNEIVETRIYQKEYARLGLVVSTAEMNDMFYGDFIHPFLTQIFTNKTTGVYDRQEVKNIIGRYDELPEEGKKQWEEIEREVKKERLNSKYTTLITKSFYTPLAIANHKIKVQSQIADVRYVVNSFAEIPDDQVKVTDADYQKYYDEHKKQFKQEDSRDIEFVAFPINPSTQDLVKIDEGIKKTFEEFQQITYEDIQSFVTSESDLPYDSLFHKTGEFNPAIDTIINKTPAGQFIAPFLSGNLWLMAKVLKFENRPDSIRFSYIPLYTNKVGAKITRTPEQAKVLADSLLVVLKTDSTQFNSIAQTYIDLPELAELKEKKGDLGWMKDGTWGIFNDQLIAAKPGDIFMHEDPSGTACFIVRVTERTPDTRKAQVAMITREIVPSEQTRKDIYAQATKFAADSRTIGEMIENAKKSGLATRNADFTQEMSNRLPGVQDARAIVRWAFDEETKTGNVAPNVFEADNMYIVAGLKDIRQKGYATLEQVKTYIENPVKMEKKAEMLIERAKKASIETKDINMLAAKMNAVVDTITAVSFDNYSFGKNGPEMSAIGAVVATTSPKLLAPIKGYNGVYTIYVDKVYKKEQPMDPKMVALQTDMQNQQKARMIFNVLKENANVVDQRYFFY